MSGEQLEGTLEIYDMLGREKASFMLNGQPWQQFKVDLSAGSYIVRIPNKYRTITKKVFIK